MISAAVEERILKGEMCRLEAGTLRLRKLRRGEDPVFVATRMLSPGDEVWLVPLDGSLVQHSSGVRVSNVVVPPAQGGS